MQVATWPRFFKTSSRMSSSARVASRARFWSVLSSIAELEVGTAEANGIRRRLATEAKEESLMVDVGR